jgi:hypothetical protein
MKIHRHFGMTQTVSGKFVPARKFIAKPPLTINLMP